MKKLMDSKLGGQVTAMKWKIHEKYGARWRFVHDWTFRGNKHSDNWLLTQAKLSIKWLKCSFVCPIEYHSIAASWFSICSYYRPYNFLIFLLHFFSTMIIPPPYWFSTYCSKAFNSFLIMQESIAQVYKLLAFLYNSTVIVLQTISKLRKNYTKNSFSLF